MESMMKECMKPHPLLHTLSGVGLGLLIVAFFGISKDTAMILGVILLVAGVLGEFLTKKK
ncbi:MAG: hypothetical protein HYT11_00730 [Candidatus Levybacteria bacterium]|nr:hypothetical protein [Candidatus Levybacteria bacterium]